MHEQMTERHFSSRITDDGRELEEETSRLICDTCCIKAPEGAHRAADWPCSTIRARAAVALLTSMIDCNEAHSARSRLAVKAAFED